MIKKAKLILWSFGLIFLYLLSQEITALIASTHKNNLIYQNIVLIVSSLVVTGILIVIFRKDFFSNFKDFKKNYKNYIPLCLKYWALGFVIMIGLNGIITTLLGGIAPNEEGNRMLIKMYPIYMVITASITSPICEELLFRLNFKKIFKSKIAKILFTGIVFGAVHAIASENLLDLLYILPYSALGITLSATFFNTDNIISSIFTHFLHNTITIIILFTFL